MPPSAIANSVNFAAMISAFLPLNGPLVTVAPESLVLGLNTVASIIYSANVAQALRVLLLWCLLMVSLQLVVPLSQLQLPALPPLPKTTEAWMRPWVQLDTILGPAA